MRSAFFVQCCQKASAGARNNRDQRVRVEVGKNRSQIALGQIQEHGARHGKAKGKSAQLAESHERNAMPGILGVDVGLDNREAGVNEAASAEAEQGLVPVDGRV